MMIILSIIASVGLYVLVRGILLLIPVVVGLKTDDPSRRKTALQMIRMLSDPRGRTQADAQQAGLDADNGLDVQTLKTFLRPIYRSAQDDAARWRLLNYYLQARSHESSDK